MVWVLWACAASPGTISKMDPQQQQPGWPTYLQLEDLLDQQDEILDFDPLMKIHNTIRKAHEPIPKMDVIIEKLINKRNPNPRVDNIILIVAAVALGDSLFPIDNAGDLFGAILNQDHRLNTWVLAYVGDALGRYPEDLSEGDQLAEILEEKVNRRVKNPDPNRERFGYHFLPPPKGEYITDYIEGIRDQRTRVFERNCYYLLIGNGVSEDQAEKSLRQVLRENQTTGEKQIGRPLKHIVQHWDLFFPDIAPKRIPRPDGL